MAKLSSAGSSSHCVRIFFFRNNNAGNNLEIIEAALVSDNDRRMEVDILFSTLPAHPEGKRL